MLPHRQTLIIMLSDYYAKWKKAHTQKTQDIEFLHLYQMSRLQKYVETESRFMVA